MMKKVSEVLGQTVVTAESGERIGKVADVLVDPSAQRLVGLVIGGGLFKSEHVLPHADVQTLGTDAVIARNADGLLGPKAWRQQGIETVRSSVLHKKPVLTTGGRQLGTLGDVYLDEVTGAVVGFEVVGSSLGGLIQKRTMLPHSEGVTIGADAVLVSEAAVAALDAERR